MSEHTPKAGATFRISAVLDGFPVEIEVHGTADALEAMIGRLHEIGADPPGVGRQLVAAAEQTRTAPVCEFHGPMTESSKRPGTYFCPKKMGDGSYCKSKA